MMEFGSPIFAQKERNPKPETRQRTPASSISPSSIPFSWEQQPGIPKPNSTRNPRPSKPDPRLPLPPPLILRPAPDISRRKQEQLRPDRDGVGLGSDPFAAALAECTKTKHYYPPAAASVDVAAAEKRRRRAKTRREFVMGPTLRVGDRFGLLDLFRSCKEAAACSVSEPAVYIPRAGAYGLLNRRSV